ncbi:SulP family inorganic anion transporter [Sphingomonas sp. CGMCC 1.13654]|uniref:SulP family inorganic anion transporter n=1 Tax=Sphingomonas chungangi TaxID=2683589 RepID=A0A838L9R2_9SPHN|nr:SulP family inorganic anion transporter [Sphingomonas chungangi]MVW54615.1 STAS domain-containing protein [Sphingomonas chungangi]
MKSADLVAGLSVAGLMLPEAVAYADIAGLPPGRALSAAVAGSLVYALAGRSRYAIVSPTSSSAAILAAALAAMPGDAATRGAIATVAIAMAGGLFLIAGALRLGSLTGFVARPVLRGFAFGLAITIIAKQLPSILGVEVSGRDIFHLLWRLVQAVALWNPISVATGAMALTALLLLRRLPKVPGAILVLAAGIGLSWLLDLQGHGVATVGMIRIDMGLPTLPALSFDRVERLAQMVVPLALILFAESWGTMRALALRHGDAIEPDRELAALGLANLASALVRGMPVGAGFSAGSASEAAGAQSRATAVVAALALALLVAVATPLIAYLPEPVLAAVVIAALTHALDPAPLIRLWRIDRDQYVALGAAAGVILLGVLNGMLFAIGLSLLAMIRRLASPQLVELGRLGDSRNYVDVTRHPEAARMPGLAIWRPAEPLFFANAERVLGNVEGNIRATPGSSGVILSLEESFDIDSTALDALLEFDQRLGLQQRRLWLARVHDRARDLLPPNLAARCSYSVDDAVQSMKES